MIPEIPPWLSAQVDQEMAAMDVTIDQLVAATRKDLENQPKEIVLAYLVNHMVSQLDHDPRMVGVYAALTIIKLAQQGDV